MQKRNKSVAAFTGEAHMDVKDHILRSKPNWNLYRHETDWEAVYKAVDKALKS